MDFILDNSVTMRWLLNDAEGERERYASKVLLSMASGLAAGVPSLWWLELSNVMVRSERKGRLHADASNEFVQLIRKLPIMEVPTPGATLLEETLILARKHALSAYDAAYLDLSIRTRTPLATLDEDLQKAAKDAGTMLFI